MGDMDMDMDMSSGTSPSVISSMSLGFHITPFDQLWFAGWTPQSSGAMVGACAGLFMLALLERGLSALRTLAEGWWRTRTEAILAQAHSAEALSSAGSAGGPSLPSAYAPLPLPFPARSATATARRLPPLIWAHDLPRAAMHVAQAALGYLLMLAYMNYNWGYLLSILAGLGVGEVLFGRAGNGSGGAH
ncbi:hypothetical protein CALCODRAFT_241034 [Calocera cornea HHB12733]|uniref:Copper transport protein n=1 Tax=Calocera cornea HHB12733 TaxID=1353952 RepID=A0A165GU62_9BASI|nr:hypothetical protein CALCODRAFT_241034 [Calocera cornea HHB12733]